MVTLIMLSGLAAWIATSTIVEAEIFRDVREAVDRLNDRKQNWFTYKLRYLISCHMCAGIWVSAIIAIWIPPLVAVPVIGWGLTALAIKGVAHLFLIAQKFLEALTEMAKNDDREYLQWKARKDTELQTLIDSGKLERDVG